MSGGYYLDGSSLEFPKPHTLALALDMRLATPKSNFLIVIFRGSVADRHREILTTFDTRNPRRDERLRQVLSFSVCHKPVEMFILVQLLLSYLFIFERIPTVLTAGLLRGFHE